MSKTITMTLPERLHGALTTKAKMEFEQEPSEFLRQFLFAAAQSKEGVVLKLELPPVTTAQDAAQPELPLTK